MRRIQLLNGDCAHEGWRRAGMPGEVLVWRENYLQGEIPRDVSGAAFCRIRARELHRIAPEIPEEAIFAELLAMEQTLAGLTGDDDLTLWFDRCPFDRAMLARVLFLLATHPVAATVRLHFRDVVWDETAFRSSGDGELVTPEKLAAGRAAWLAYLDGARPETLLTGPLWPSE